MSENEANDNTAASLADANAAEVDEVSESPAELAAPQPRENTARRRRTGGIAWLALLLAVGAAGLATRPYWEPYIVAWDENTADKTALTVAEFQTLTDRVGKIGGKTERNAQAIEELLQDLAQVETELKAALEERPTQGFSDRADQLAMRLERLEGEYNTRFGGVRSRVGDLEEQVGRRLEQFELRLEDAGSGLARADRDLVTRLRLIEVDSLFALAQDQLALSSNTDAARRHGGAGWSA